MTVLYPEDLKYHKEHTWARIDGDTATIGVTDFAQDQLGEIVFVELPAAGSAVEAGVPFAEIESTKSVSDVYSPVSGEIVEANAEVSAAPELINQDCYGEGWLIKVKVSEEAADLMDSAAYQQVIAE
ncbi:MAG: glycine cleavage system protein GcvH [Candidatus Geothermincolia bacterium]